MKIKTTAIEIECTADELRQSNTLSDGFYNLFRKAFNGGCDCSSEEPEEAAENQEG